MYHFNTSDQRKVQGYKSHVSLCTGATLKPQGFVVTNDNKRLMTVEILDIYIIIQYPQFCSPIKMENKISYCYIIRLFTVLLCCYTRS